MSLTNSFFGRVIDKISDSFESYNELMGCLEYVARYQKISIKWNDINNIDQLKIESISLYEKPLGMIFQPVSLSSEDNVAKIFHPILIQLDGSAEFRVILPNKFGKNNLYHPKSKCVEKLTNSVINNKSNKAWQCCPINFPLPSDFSGLLALIFQFCKKDIFFSLGLSIFVSASTLFVSLFSGYMFSHMYNLNNNYVVIYFVFFIFILCSALFNYISDLYFKSLNAKIIIRALPSVWNHIFGLPLKAISKFSSGDFVQRIMDYESSLSIIVTTILAVLVGMFSMIFLISYMSYCSLLLSFIYFFIYFVLICIKILVFPKNTHYMNAYLASQGKMTSILNEALMQIDKIRSANVENNVYKRWLYHLVSAKTYAEKSVKLETLMWLIDALIPVSLLVIFYIFLYFNAKTIDTYCWLQFMICAGQLSVNFEKFSTDLISLVHLLPALKRLAPIINDDIEKYPVMQSNVDLAGEIKLSNISLRNPQTRSFILKNVSMNIKPGSFVAIVGQSGAGKSSIFKLLLGFESKYSGLISINNADIKNLDMSLVRKEFGVVLQSTNIFPGTIFSNIAVNANITLDHAWRLAEYVGLDEDIKAMPMRMYTHVSDNAGESISGGQKQKILIARALATHPKILFLDEATSALDNNSQSLIFNNLKSLHITRFVIAHRHSTIANADLIYVLNNGKIIDSGLYHELLNRGRLN